MDALDLIIISLAAWRLASLLVAEDGPFDLFDRLRALVSRWSLLDSLFACVWCMSIWTAALMLVIYQEVAWVVVVFAVSALAVLIQVWIQERTA